ncbi:MAG: hypothetical protein GY713_11270 [Actinomycetia bacterium]|nr:hypothetical protein [Actinomycetes bacterium]
MPERADIKHPLPHASWETRGWWEGAGRGEVVLQQCRGCQVPMHKPRAVCPTCLGTDIEHFVASGQGTVHTFTVTNQNQQGGFAEACPYVLALVELAEGPKVLTNIVGCEVDEVSIGMSVVVDFVAGERDDAEAFAVPVFRPA